MGSCGHSSQKAGHRALREWVLRARVSSGPMFSAVVPSGASLSISHLILKLLLSNDLPHDDEPLFSWEEKLDF